MPKIKTKRGASKRFTRNAGGKFSHRQSHRSHILTKKRTKRKRQLRHMAEFDRSDVRSIKRLIPYS